jgi:alpha-amylase/alpha-mannosidase (GH57 family)
MEENAPATYQAILDADRESRQRRSGHGNAIAQPYNHMILPLANRADKYTQVLWGIRDFEYRFGRQPEGMWLPETAVDTETLEILPTSAFALQCWRNVRPAVSAESAAAPGRTCRELSIRVGPIACGSLLSG